MSDDLLSPNHRDNPAVCKVWRSKQTGALYEFVSVAQTLPDLKPLVLFQFGQDTPTFAMPADKFHAKYEPVWTEQ